MALESVKEPGTKESISDLLGTESSSFCGLFLNKVFFGFFLFIKRAKEIFLFLFLRIKVKK
jgi:hypothetical protein